MNLSENARLVARNPQSVRNELIASLVWCRSGLQRIHTAWIARRQRIREVEILYSFNDRELRDLGLCRSDLPAITSGLYRPD